MKRRSVLTMLLALVLAFVLMPMNAEAATGGSCGDGVTWSFDEATGTLTISGEGAMDDYSWLDQPWADISDGVTTVVIEEGVTHVGDNAFYCCDNADTAIIASTVTEVGTYAFYGHFEEFYFKGNVPQTGNLAFFSKVGATAYYPQGDATWTEDARDGIDNYLQWKTWQTGAPDIEPEPTTPVPDEDNLEWVLDISSGTLTLIGTGAMTNYTENAPWYDQRGEIKTVVFSEGITSIGDNAFNGCYAITNISIPENVTSIGDAAFRNCSGLLSVTLPEGILSIGDSAFRECRKLETINLPDGLTEIGERAFQDCIYLRSITIPGSVSVISKKMFSTCNRLSRVIIQNGVSVIGESAFSDCSALTNITIPASITAIQDRAFDNCGVNTVIFEGSAPEFGIALFSGGTVTAYYPEDKPEGYGGHKGTFFKWIPYEGHIHTYTETVTAPTCTEQGYTTCTCSCGDSYVDNYVAEAGHKPGDQWLTDSENHWHVCIVCEEILDAQAHSAGERCEVCEMEFVTEPEHLYSLGDSSHDGNINAKDATLVLRYSVGSIPENMVFCELCADYTGDGNINAKDATKILRASVGLP